MSSYVRPIRPRSLLAPLFGIALALSPCLGAPALPDVILADFEGANYGEWTTTGTAFGPGPAQGTLPNQMPVSGFLGHGLVNSYYGGDGTTGTLTSPEFEINRQFISFLIGGGDDPKALCLNLKVAGQVVRTATGPNKEPGGSERLDMGYWDLTELAGKRARIEIVDQATGGWGHLNVDQIVLTDQRPKAPGPQQREIVLEKRYLHLPVKNGSTKRRLSVLIGGRTVREFEIELADAAPDFCTFLDVSAFQGQSATLRVEKVPESYAGLKAIVQSDAVPDAESLYKEPLRPQFHFTSRRGWNNDPNGLVFYQGEYHLYYQHNPYGYEWGNMHWGHAVSPDLVHWQELPIALYPVRFGDWAFSGSAVVDWKNTAGFKTGTNDVLVAGYTSTGRGECIVFSNDRGRTFTEYAGNPVVKHRGRDPRLLWHAPTQRWVMAVYDEAEDKRWIAFYTSPDLKTWQYQSRNEGFFECPDIFELRVDGRLDQRKWVLTAASSEYQVGTFDGKRFVAETPLLPGHRGNAFYAAQTYSDLPAADGRRVQIGWGQVATPGMPFNQMMMFPCELTLRGTPAGPRLCFFPVREIEKLYTRKQTWPAKTLQPGDNPLADVRGELLDLQVEFELQGANHVGLRVRDQAIIYSAAAQELSCADRRNPLPLKNGRLRLRVLVDRTSLEVFANDGELYMPMRAVPTAVVSTPALALFAEGAPAKLVSLQVNQLNSAWR